MTISSSILILYVYNLNLGRRVRLRIRLRVSKCRVNNSMNHWTSILNCDLKFWKRKSILICQTLPSVACQVRIHFISQEIYAITMCIELRSNLPRSLSVFNLQNFTVLYPHRFNYKIAEHLALISCRWLATWLPLVLSAAVLLLV